MVLVTERFNRTSTRESSSWPGEKHSLGATQSMLLRLAADHDSEIGRTEGISQLASLWVLGRLHHGRGILFQRWSKR